MGAQDHQGSSVGRMSKYSGSSKNDAEDINLVHRKAAALAWYRHGRKGSRNRSHSSYAALMMAQQQQLVAMAHNHDTNIQQQLQFLHLHRQEDEAGGNSANYIAYNIPPDLLNCTSPAAANYTNASPSSVDSVAAPRPSAPAAANYNHYYNFPPDPRRPSLVIPAQYYNSIHGSCRYQQCPYPRKVSRFKREAMMAQAERTGQAEQQQREHSSVLNPASMMKSANDFDGRDCQLNQAAAAAATAAAAAAVASTTVPAVASANTDLHGSNANNIDMAGQSLALLSLLPQQQSQKYFQLLKKMKKTSRLTHHKGYNGACEISPDQEEMAAPKGRATANQDHEPDDASPNINHDQSIDDSPWDCGSSLYDSFELLSLSSQLGRCLTTVNHNQLPYPAAYSNYYQKNIKKIKQLPHHITYSPTNYIFDFIPRSLSLSKLIPSSFLNPSSSIKQRSSLIHPFSSSSSSSPSELNTINPSSHISVISSLYKSSDRQQQLLMPPSDDHNNHQLKLHASSSFYDKHQHNYTSPDVNQDRHHNHSKTGGLRKMFHSLLKSFNMKERPEATRRTNLSEMKSDLSKDYSSCQEEPAMAAASKSCDKSTAMAGSMILHNDESEVSSKNPCSISSCYSNENTNKTHTIKGASHAVQSSASCHGHHLHHHHHHLHHHVHHFRKEGFRTCSSTKLPPSKPSKWVQPMGAAHLTAQYAGGSSSSTTAAHAAFHRPLQNITRRASPIRR